MCTMVLENRHRGPPQKARPLHDSGGTQDPLFPNPPWPRPMCGAQLQPPGWGLAPTAIVTRPIKAWETQTAIFQPGKNYLENYNIF
jgi:hypothetical protein